MKKLITCAVLLGAIISTGFSQNSAFDKVFDRYAGKDGFTTVEISSNLFNMFVEEEDKLDEVKLGNIKILAADEDKLNNNLNFYKDIVPKLKTSEYNKLMQVKDSDVDMVILQSKKDNDHNEFLMVVGGESNALIYFEGSLNFDEAKKVTKKLGEQYIDSDSNRL